MIYSWAVLPSNIGWFSINNLTALSSWIVSVGVTNETKMPQSDQKTSAILSCSYLPARWMTLSSCSVSQHSSLQASSPCSPPPPIHGSNTCSYHDTHKTGCLPPHPDHPTGWDGNNTRRSWIHDHWRTRLYPDRTTGLETPTWPQHGNRPEAANAITNCRPCNRATQARHNTRSPWPPAPTHGTRLSDTTQILPVSAVAPDPNMPHLLRNCPHTQQAKTRLASPLRQPTNTCEERLLAATIHPDITLCHPTEHILRAWLQDWVTQSSEAHIPIFIATNERGKNDCAPWAVAMGDTTIAKPIHREDTTAFAAEITAIVMVAEG